MEIIKYNIPQDFLNDTQEYLEQHEAENNIILADCLSLRNKVQVKEKALYLSAVKNEGQIILAAMMSSHKRLTFTSDTHSAESAISLLAQHLFTEDHYVPGIMARKNDACLFSTIWPKLTSCEIKEGMNMRLYTLTEVIPVPSQSGRFRVAQLEDQESLTEFLYAYYRKEFNKRISSEEAALMVAQQIARGQLHLWEDQEIVSMARFDRPTSHGVIINEVYTPPEFRRRGYATACVAALSQKLLDQGYHFCALYTDLDNPTSNSVYIKIGYTKVCDFKYYSFEYDV